MLGDIVAELTNSETAADTAAVICPQPILDRIYAAAARDAVPPGSVIATRVRHLIEHGGEDIWLDLMGAIAASPQPGAAALQRMLTYAFPDPVRVRIGKRHA